MNFQCVFVVLSFIRLFGIASHLECYGRPIEGKTINDMQPVFIYMASENG